MTQILKRIIRSEIPHVILQDLQIHLKRAGDSIDLLAFDVKGNPIRSMEDVCNSVALDNLINSGALTLWDEKGEQLTSLKALRSTNIATLKDVDEATGSGNPSNGYSGFSGFSGESLSLPDQTGYSGKYLFTNGNIATWETVIGGSGEGSSGYSGYSGSGISGYSGKSSDDTVLNNIASTGIQYGGFLSKNIDDTKFNVSSGAGYIIDNYSNPSAPVITKVVWGDKTAVVDDYLLTDSTTSIAINSSGNIIQQNTPFTSSQYRDLIIIGKTIHQSRTIINSVSNLQNPFFDSTMHADDLAYSFGTINVSGNIFSAASTNLTLFKTFGTVYRLGSNYTSSYKNPNFKDVQEMNPVNFTYRYRNGLGAFINSAITTNVSPGYYDNNTGTPTALSKIKNFTIQRIYVFPTGNIVITYGQKEYTDYTSARAGLSTEVPILDPNLQDAILRCYLIIRGDTTDLSNIDYAVFNLASKLGEMAGGAVSLSISGYSGSGISGFSGYSGAPIENPLTVKNGGTGVQILNPYSVLCGGVSGDGAVQSIVSAGSQYQVLISNGPSTLPTMQLVTENSISLSNNTTNNVSSLKHGFAPILSDVPTQFLNGQGNWTTPTGIVNSYLTQSFSNKTSVNVSHGFGAFPVIQIIDETGAVLIPLSIINNTLNDFTVTFLVSTSGNIIASVGSPQPQSLIIVNDSYATLATDRIVQCVSSGKTITLLTAIGNAGREFIIDNHSTGNITVLPTGSEKIEDESYQILPPNSAMNIYSDGTGYRIY